MAKKIIRYLLEGDGTIPKFVEDGGYMPIGEEYVGISVDEEKRHLPTTVHVLDEADLQARANQMSFENEDAKQAMLDYLLSKV